MVWTPGGLLSITIPESRSSGRDSSAPTEAGSPAQRPPLQSAPNRWWTRSQRALLASGGAEAAAGADSSVESCGGSEGCGSTHGNARRDEALDRPMSMAVLERRASSMPSIDSTNDICGLSNPWDTQPVRFESLIWVTWDSVESY